MNAKQFTSGRNTEGEILDFLRPKTGPSLANSPNEVYQFLVLITIARIYLCIRPSSPAQPKLNLMHPGYPSSSDDCRDQNPVEDGDIFFSAESPESQRPSRLTRICLNICTSHLHDVKIHAFNRVFIR